MAEGIDPAARRRIVALEQELQRLRDEVAQLRESIQPAQWTLVDEAPAGIWPGGTAPGVPIAGPPQGGIPSPGSTGQAVPGSHPGPGSQPVPGWAGSGPAGAPAERGPSHGLEARIGTRWLAVAGITVSVVAAVLFLRLAIQNGWIGPVAQIALIAVLGMLVWGVGAFLDQRKRLAGFPHVLAAGGVTIAAFAAYATYGLETYREALGTSQEVAALLMAVVAAAALVDAVLRRTELQASLVTVLVPLTAGFVLEWTSFSLAYTVVMAGALLAAAAWCRWTSIPVLAAMGSYGIVLSHAFGDVAAASALAAAVLLLAAFNAVALRVRDGQGVAAAQVIAWVGTWGVGVWAFQAWGLDAWWWTAIVGATAMALSFAPATRIQRLAWRVVGLTGLIGFAAMLPWPGAIAAVWIVELAAVGAFRKMRPMVSAEAVAAVLSGLVALRLLIHEAEIINYRVEGWHVALISWCAAIIVLAALWFIERDRSGNRAAQGHVHLGLAVAGTVALAALLLDGPAVSLTWAVIAVGLIALGFAGKRIDLRIAGLSTFAATLLRILFVDLAGVDAAWRVLAFAGVGLALLGTSWLYVRWERQAA